MSKKLFKIGDLAEHFGISTDIIRHYDKLGLLTPQVIKDNGYRYYSIDQVFDLEFILNMRALDMSLHDIGEMLNPDDSISIQSRLQSQADALRSQIETLQNMLSQTQTYMDLVNPKDDLLNTWYLGKRPQIHYVGSFFNIKNEPSFKDFRQATGHLKKNWFRDMKFFIRSDISVLKSPDNFDDVSQFTFGSYEPIAVKKEHVLEPSRALVCRFHDDESKFDSCYTKALEELEKLNLTPQGNVYSLDAFGWRSGGKIYLTTDLYIDLKEQ